jgi:hypothetical protein
VISVCVPHTEITVLLRRGFLRIIAGEYTEPFAMDSLIFLQIDEGSYRIRGRVKVFNSYRKGFLWKLFVVGGQQVLAFSKMRFILWMSFERVPLLPLRGSNGTFLFTQKAPFSFPKK